MIQHPKQYEDVFSTDRPKITTPFRIENLSADGMVMDEYISLFRSFLNDFYSNLFLNCVKLSWLRRKFIFYGHKFTLPIHRKNSATSHISFQKLMMRLVGKDIRLITKGPFYTKLEFYYFDIFFPDFDKGNPFEDPDSYKFPFENLSLEYLLVVYELEDRIELLKHANDNKMSFAVFLDYINNHILSENERLGRERYSLRNSPWGGRMCLYYVRDSEKDSFLATGKRTRRKPLKIYE